ncbi:dihydroorotase [Pseudoalteromonas sp. McH1-7]|uniref:Dihydroorotase n=1 Tax=Pseudoalteromonas peptidolytica F12-50-A1 TaxID=1315280 RepID=A0A8I0MUL2_9GAMM|nr:MULTISPECIES: dihydroorotase [Pseudoalteromonas]MBE0345688.1 dihydroorotase [Pseudoalteromonas peptidolytica F12-50-A1]MDW7547790.1 dihydroorotase [Pseudoalteromonas peptidolytica]NLR14309.1 dihydroorotase [Pseudoalteromonas peptidolytica]NUZ11336.1 dihydroorotase [Pseudoalteromonas sp. McH1-7]USD27606.1 dihydroorotase [Pseudoalteromonas sp. SCSIO 43201]
MSSKQTLTITRPDDWHVHLRDGDVLVDTVRDISRYMGRAIIMPNLVPPATCTDSALAYRERIMGANPQGNFEPLMVLYLTDNTTPEEIKKAKATGHIVAAKLYPAGATTNSDSGVTDIENVYPALEAMQEVGMLLLVHGEVTDSSIDIFDREKVFLETKLSKVVDNFPSLKIVLEHITTKDAVDFVTNAPDNVAATITAHHLLYNRNHMLAGGIRPHYYCLPILKRNTHQQALITAATSGSKKFFLGTDSAPHAKDKKEAACGCAGAYTAHAAIELYAEAFEEAGALDKLEGFASHFGPDFYNLPRNQDTITLTKSPWVVPDSYTLGTGSVVPIKAGGTIDWKVD